MDEEYDKTNRDKKLELGDKSKFICRCDRAMAGRKGRCPICKRFNSKHKIRRE